MKKLWIGVMALLVLAACVTPDRFKTWALGSPPFKGAIDYKKGLVFIEYRTDASGEDPRADANGIIKRGVHLCGGYLDYTLAVLQNDLKWRYDNARLFGLGDVVTCKTNDTKDTCSHPSALEFDVTGDYMFENDKLRYVVQIEDGTISPAFRKAGREYANKQIAANAGKRCP